jgi:acyl-CoA synthetase (AMP-forming)/AMP-acid ligase II
VSELVNVADLVRAQARRAPEQAALIEPAGAGWRATTFAQLERRIDLLAHATRRAGLRRGDRVLVLVRPGAEWAALLFALFRLGAVPALIDPAMGLIGVLTCVERLAPRGFVGTTAACALSLVFGRAFRSVEVRLTAGRLALGALPLNKLVDDDEGAFEPAPTFSDDPAAILFTSGSTGPAKGVVYTHGMCCAQTAALRELYGMREGEVDVACFAPFALFGPALGLTTVLPRIDFSRPARAQPEEVVRALREHRAVQCFGSPAIWRRVAPWCAQRAVKLDGLKRLMVAGAPVHPSLIEDCRTMLPDGDVHTPYGATEALPVSSASGGEILEARDKTARGAGNFVGRPAPGCEVRVIAIRDDAIAVWSDALLVKPGELGELVVRGGQVTREYALEPEHTAASKIREGASVWHRMGDLVRVDESGALWFQGRKAHRLETECGVFGPVGVENVFRSHVALSRCALVGVGERGREKPVLVVEPHPGLWPKSSAERSRLAAEVRAAGNAHPLGARVEHVLFRRALPVDVRHNAKIDRGELKRWAQEQLA